MCFNVVCIALKKNKYINVPELYQKVKYHSIINNDGFSIHVVNSSNNEFILRTTELDEFENYIENFVKIMRKVKLVHVHFRKATSGAVTPENAHMFPVTTTKRVFRLSHNGFVSGFEKNNEKSDTRIMSEDPQFSSAIEYLIEKQNPRKLVKYIKTRDFYGIAFLTSPDTVIAISRNKDMHIYYDRSILCMSNSLLSLEKKIQLTKNIALTARVPHASIENAIIVVTKNFDKNKITVYRFREPKREYYFYTCDHPYFYYVHFPRPRHFSPPWVED